MASACVNNIGVTPENFLDCPAGYTSYGWLSPRISFSRDFTDEESKIAAGKTPCSSERTANASEKLDLDVSGKDAGDFEFRLEDPVTMLPADELFSDGKLVPLQVSVLRPAIDLPSSSTVVRSPETAQSRRRTEALAADPYLFSPKAPRCSSRWKELLGLKRLNQNPKQDIQKGSAPSRNPNPKSLKHFLHRNPKSSSTSDSSLSLPLLKDSDCESVSLSSSRLSLSSSSSSGPDHEELPRLSLDSDKSNPNQIPLNKNPPKVRLVKPKMVASDTPRPFAAECPSARVGRSPMRRAPDSTNAAPVRGASVDSPRMNSSGKIVFQSLERSSSSPSSFNGPRHRYKGMERSYSANVRVTPVLNVPVCSLRGSSKSGSVFGFGQLFSSPQKRDGGGGGATRNQHNNNRNRSDRSLM